MAQQREEARRAIIEEERQRLLREHAVKLFGYLPKDLERYVVAVLVIGFLIFDTGSYHKWEVHHDPLPR